MSFSLQPQFANGNNDSTTEEVILTADKATQPTSTQPADEATLIEERRKRREAIKARHRGQATPLLVQALALHTTSAPLTHSAALPEEIPAQGKLCCYGLIAATDM